MPDNPTAGSNLLWIVSLTVHTIVLAVFILERWVGERTWVMALLTYAPQAAWVALPALLLLWALLARNWAATAISLGVLLVALFGIAGLELPASAPRKIPGTTVRVATWNIHDYRGDMSRLTNRIRSWDCDILCVQEARHPKLRRLLPEYAHASLSDLRTFVRGEITDRVIIHDGHRYIRPALACKVEIAGQQLWIVNAHLSMSDRRETLTRRDRPLREYLANSVRVREAQFDAILQWLPTHCPVLIAGDFNTPPNSMFHRRMSARLTDSFGRAGLGFGYSFLARRMPVFRIDYIWLGNGPRPISCRTDGARPSDHRPVVAEILLPEPVN